MSSPTHHFLPDTRPNFEKPQLHETDSASNEKDTASNKNIVSATQTSPKH